MKTSESIIKIAPAYLKAQKAMGGAVKSADNPFFHSKYADLPEVMKACKAELNAEGISVMQPICGEVVVTRLLHESGEWMESDGTRILTPKVNDPQAQGSAITYARRYDLQSLVFIPAVDDDGENAMDRNSGAPKPTQAPLVKTSPAPVEEKPSLNPGKCKIHDVQLEWLWSAKKNTWYAAHKLSTGVCFGK